MKTKFIIGAFAISFLSACAAVTTPVDEDYEFGDTLDSVISIQAKYCAETNPTKRAIYLSAAKSIAPFYPERGACTDLSELVGGEDAVSMIAENELDVSEAIEEQKKYQEYLENQDQQ